MKPNDQPQNSSPKPEVKNQPQKLAPASSLQDPKNPIETLRRLAGASPKRVGTRLDVFA